MVAFKHDVGRYRRITNQSLTIFKLSTITIYEDYCLNWLIYDINTVTEFSLFQLNTTRFLQIHYNDS